MKKMNKPTFYLHIGYPKTATSFIQSIVVERSNNSFLRNKGIYATATFISEDFQKDLNFFKSSSINELKTFFNKVVAGNKKCSKFLISKESLTSLDQELVEKLSKVLSFAEVKIIVYLRRQDHLCESSWKQWDIKTMSFNEKYQDFLKNPILYSQYLNVWEKAFGLQNLIVRCYEKEQLPNGIQADFFNLIDIDHKNLKLPEKVINPGFNRDILEIMYLSRNILKDQVDNSLNDLFSFYEIGIKKAHESYNLLTSEMRKEIINIHENDNSLIARKYLNRIDGILFYEKIDDNPETINYNGISIEKLIPIYTELFLKQQRKISNLEWKINTLEPLSLKILRRLKKLVK